MQALIRPFSLPEIRMPRSILTFFVLLGCHAPCIGQAFVERLDPPALERGKTTRLTVVGSHLAGAVDLWTSLPGSKVKATATGENKLGVSFDVSVAADAPVGLFGLRVA